MTKRHITTLFLVIFAIPILTAVKVVNAGTSKLPLVAPAPTPPLLPPPAITATRLPDLTDQALNFEVPKRSARAQKARAFGTVKVLVNVNQTGKVVFAKAADGPALLRQTAVNAARQLVFEPFVDGDRPVAVSGTVKYDFVESLPLRLDRLTKIGDVETSPTGPNLDTKPAKPPKLVSGGVLNGRAVRSVKPLYPPAAKAVDAKGSVSIMVLVDEMGKVVSADAVSGHPLLRASATNAARQFTFAPVILSGVPIRVNGVLIFDF